MSQHLIDTGERMTTRSEAHGNGAHTKGENNGPASPEREQWAPNASDASPDATVSALDALSGAIGEMKKDQELLQQRLEGLKRQRMEGKAWRDILAEEDAPGTMQVVSRMLACLAKASGTLRKELVDTLRREGVSIPAIAKLFGVTHQRVSNLLRRPTE